MLPFFQLLFILRSDAFVEVCVCEIRPKETCIWWEVHVPGLPTCFSRVVSALPHWASRSKPVIYWFLCEEPKLTNYFSWVGLFLPKPSRWWKSSLSTARLGWGIFFYCLFPVIGQPFGESEMADFRLDSSYVQIFCGQTPSPNATHER